MIFCLLAEVILERSKMEFVNYIIAKKLKEKGFSDLCFGHYFGGIFQTDMPPKQYQKEKYVSAPTIDQVLNWIRKEHDIDIDILTYHTFASARHRAYAARIVTLNMFDETLNRIEDPEMHIKWEDAALWAIEYVIDYMII